MRYSTLLAIAAVLGLATGPSLGKEAVVVTVKNPAAGSYSGVSEGHHHGLFHRLCGKPQPTCAEFPGARPGPTTMTYILDSPFRPCTIHPTGFTTTSDGLGGPRGHCFPDCFLGTPCSCCRHSVRYLSPHHPRGRAYEALIRMGHPSVRPIPVQDPGPLAPILRRKHFDPS